MISISIEAGQSVAIARVMVTHAFFAVRESSPLREE
jgi:hypothetical protein